MSFRARWPSPRQRNARASHSAIGTIEGAVTAVRNHLRAVLGMPRPTDSRAFRLLIHRRNSPNPPKSSPSPTPTSISTENLPDPPQIGPRHPPCRFPRAPRPSPLELPAFFHCLTSASTRPSLPPPPSAPELHYEQSNLSASVGAELRTRAS